MLKATLNFKDCSNKQPFCLIVVKFAYDDSQQVPYCIPRTKYVRGILWFSRRYASASAFHRLRDNFRKPYRIASIFDM